jgi:hypothetical protein
MQAVVILSFASAGVITLVFILFLISLMDRFKTRSLYLFLGVLMMINGIIIAGIIVVYTLLYAKDAKMTFYRKYKKMYKFFSNFNLYFIFFKLVLKLL